MNVLWITNILFPEAEQLLIGSGELKASGGWMLGAANALLERGDCNLYIATVSNLVKKLTKLKGKELTYYVLPIGKGNTQKNLEYIPYWQQIKQEIQPDVIHIHGTEYSHGHAYILACGSENVVLSIQGLLHAITPYYFAGIERKDILRYKTLKDYLRGSISDEQKSMEKRSLYEIETIRMVKHIIGRTSWDKIHTWAVNSSAVYHFCNETLRKEFYDGSVWNYYKCQKHSIFLSQAGYPLKGLHQVLKAMDVILRHYPDTIIRIAGSDITACSSWSEIIRLSGYGLYIKKLIKKYHLKEKVFFVGYLNGEEMKQEYLRSNVFVCPSSIENSPNSLGEAQILGVPCVASYVGGIPDMMKGNEENLYRFEEETMMAEKICRIFSNKDVQINMMEEAKKRHDRQQNSNQLYRIYKTILSANL